ncbi:hypothetical protein [Catellatospora vulcania]|uniref:hypothetical protein n=1 Tax=Catellatospora vulcania TaxID=1460450 RepID=UPI0012D48612|nr:hypothetical protein [Catellatospora vulcania]
MGKLWFATCAIVGLAGGLMLASALRGRDGLETGVWIAGLVLAAATLLLAVTPTPGAAGSSPSTTGGWLVWAQSTSRRRATMSALMLLIPLAIVAVPAGLMAPSPAVMPSPSWSASPSPSVSSVSAGTARPVGKAQITVNPVEVTAGGAVQVSGNGFDPRETVRVELFNGANLKKFDGPYLLLDAPADDFGRLATVAVTIPAELCCTGATVRMVLTGRDSHRGTEKLITLA